MFSVKNSLYADDAAYFAIGRDYLELDVVEPDSQLLSPWASMRWQRMSGSR